MFVAFNITDFSVFNTKEYFDHGIVYYDGCAADIEDSLKAYITQRGEIDAKSLMNDRFPSVDAIGASSVFSWTRKNTCAT